MLGRQVDEPLRDVDPDHLDASLSERVGVPARSAPDIEHPVPRHQSQLRRR